MTVAHPERALLLGGASCVWDDVAALEALYGRPWDGLVIAANDIGAHWPRPLHHWVSLHPNKFRKWRALREELQHSQPGSTWGRFVEPLQTWSERPRWDKDLPMCDHILVPWLGGSSGMFAVQVARELQCTRAVLCGVPMTPTAHFSESREEGFGPKWGSADSHWRAWEQHAHLMEGWVRSMSGRTQDLLGAPTVQWFEQ